MNRIKKFIYRQIIRNCDSWLEFCKEEGSISWREGRHSYHLGVALLYGKYEEKKYKYLDKLEDLERQEKGA